MEIYPVMIIALVFVSLQVVYYSTLHYNHGKFKRHHAPASKNKLWLIASFIYAAGLGYFLWLIISLVTELV